MSAPSPDTITALVEAQRSGRQRARDLVEEACASAERHASLNALAHADWDRARALADELDADARAGRMRGRLHGIPVTVKDLFAVAGMPMRAGTRASLPSLAPPARASATLDAGAVARLRREGAVLVGKSNMHEIALGATGENVWTGDVRNPVDPARQSGGSTSGGAVAVATGIGLAALGSDTGGSIRIPAAFCGQVGFKPTWGAVPLDGALPLSWTCDHGGPIVRSVDDAARLYAVLSRRQAEPARVARRPRLAVPADWLRGRLAPAVRGVFERRLAQLGEFAEVAEVPMAWLALAWEAYTPLVRAEAAHVHRDALAAGGEGFSSMVLPALQAGAAMPVAAYLRAFDARRQVQAELDRVLAGWDAIVLPTSPVVPPLRGSQDVAVEGGRMTVREAVLGQTLPFSLAGLPALTVPMGRVDDDGGRDLPVGLQLVGARDQDALLLALARAIEAWFAGGDAAAALVRT